MRSDAAIDGGRVLADLDELHALTGDERGAQRLAWTEPWAAARRWLIGRLEQLPVDVERDEAGNLWALLRGREEETVLVGGHLDSVPDGGRLDGSLNVVAGLEVLRAVAAGGRPRRSLALVDWADEEGARFGRSLLGSGLACGVVEPGEVAALTDADGVTLAAAMARQGVDLSAAPRARRRLEPVVAALELHIEQGPVLERAGVALGAVTGTLGITRSEATIRGRSAHAGGTPFELRRDAALAGVRLAAAAHDAALARRGLATIASLATRPRVGWVVQEGCELRLDQRHGEAETLRELHADVRAAADRIAAEQQVSISWRPLDHFEPVAFDPALIDLLERNARAVAGSCERLPSGPLHDSWQLARSGIPTGMLFVQSVDGISHHRDEATRPDHVELAVETLARSVGELLAAGRG
ncbi:Zn-dependent hydrolase [Conexibacter arvalis]|uniref:N-carbamoyl-L-amino-acid hydrolase n=1 Tax=Conexibacter arvalis TaxID=912552 RepID=A0A840IFD1_9ACTN|nr:Zn-dependent hydrolase [Conexibacter arvalis]MBB4663035.1 N-carbamoyl-L-amino-acid hydrolase [Conexibacter arvalis]